MSEKITIRVASVLTALILVLTAVTPVYAAEDTTIPTLTAVVNNGMLTVDATDDASGIAAIYINGFEFTELDNGSITIRMQQYDTGYQYFVMQAKDGAGNLSEVYRVNNPYYSFPDEDNGEDIPDSTLPTDAKPTKPSDSEGEVTDHVKTDKQGKKTDRRSKSSSEKSNSSSSSSNSSSSSSSKKSSSSSVKKSAIEEDDDDEDMEVDSASKITAEGREFYTIATKTGKIFYLVIDRTKDEETVHFLTDITENDLLNATEDNKPTLPQNSAVVIKDAGLADMSAGSGRDGEEAPEKEESTEESVSDDSLLIDTAEGMTEEAETEPEKELSPVMSFVRNNLVLILAGVLSVLALIIYFAVKTIGKDKDDDYEEDEEQDDEEDEEAYPEESEEDEEMSENDDFFERMQNSDEEDEEKGLTKEEPPEEPEKEVQKEYPRSEKPVEPEQRGQEAETALLPTAQDIPETTQQSVEQKDPETTQQPTEQEESKTAQQPEEQKEPDPVYIPFPEKLGAIQENVNGDTSQYTSTPAQNVETVDPDEEEPEEDEQEID